MGGSDVETPPKAPKTSSVQEQPPATSSSPATATAIYPDWSGFQAYSPIPPHGFFPSASPQAHPYMWGAQHLLPPYGTPPPYVMYPHGGLYAHPTMPPGAHPFSPYAIPSPNGTIDASGAVTGGTEGDGKSSEAKERSALKRSKGSLGSLNMITGKNNNDVGKTSGASANGVYSHSGESGSEGSCEGSDANSQNDSQPKMGGGQDSIEAEASRNGSASCVSQNGFTRTHSQGMLAQAMPIMPVPAVGAPGGVAGPTTNLNIGMEYWGAPTSSPAAPIRGKVPNTSVVAGGIVPSSQNISSDLWLQDERELKRQRRKQSNRESARRSRLRKQAECEELAQRVDVLKEENNALRAEVSRLRKEHEQLISQNNSLKERLGEIPRGSEDPKFDRNGQQPAGDEHQVHLDTEAQAGKTDIARSGC